MVVLPRNFFVNPDLYWVEYRGTQGIFADMTRDTYHRSIFTDRSRIIARNPKPTIFELEELYSIQERLGAHPTRLNFIAHTANCGSTLLSRALDLPGRTIGYREPFPLRQLGVEHAATLNNAQRPPGWGERLYLALTLLGRKFSDIETPVVKANIPVNFILADVLRLLPEYRVLILYSNLEDFLISALKTREHRQWLNRVAKALARPVQYIVNTSGLAQVTLTDPKLAAALWVAQIHALQGLLEINQHIATIDSTRFFEQTDDSLFSVARLFEIDISRADALSIAKSDLFKFYSKNPGRIYDNETRRSEQARVRQDLQAEIREGMAWGEALLERCNVNPRLSNPLLPN